MEQTPRCTLPPTTSQGAFIRQQVMQLAPEVAASLGVPAQQVTSAMAAALAAARDEAVGQVLGIQGQGLGMALELRHDCRYIGCRSALCDLCRCNPKKKCLRQLDSKYIAGEVMKAACGAELQLSLTTTGAAEADTVDKLLPDLFVKVCAIDAKAYHTLSRNATHMSDETWLDRLVVPLNKEGKPLVVSSQVEPTGDCLMLPMREQTIVLPKLSMTESSEALLAGQKPRLKLLLQAVDSQGQRISAIPPLLSDDFVVTTTRSNVRKPDIPLVTDPVSKLQAVGKETVSKLRDMQAAAAASLNAEDPEVLEEFTCQTRCIVTVRDFQKLLDWCEQDPERTKTVQRVLKLMRGWDAAASHARSAVPEDSCTRMFSAGTDMALLFACKHGKVDLSKITGRARILQNESGTGVTLAAIEEMERSTLQQQHVATLLQQAQAQWEAPGHPGWGFAGGRDEAARGFTQSPQGIGDPQEGLASSSDDPSVRRVSSAPVPDRPVSSLDLSQPWVPASSPISAKQYMPAEAAALSCNAAGYSSDELEGRKRSRQCWEDQSWHEAPHMSATEIESMSLQDWLACAAHAARAWSPGEACGQPMVSSAVPHSPPQQALALHAVQPAPSPTPPTDGACSAGRQRTAGSPRPLTPATALLPVAHLPFLHNPQPEGAMSDAAALLSRAPSHTIASSPPEPASAGGTRVSKQRIYTPNPLKQLYTHTAGPSQSKLCHASPGVFMSPFPSGQASQQFREASRHLLRPPSPMGSPSQLPTSLSAAGMFREATAGLETEQQSAEAAHASPTLSQLLGISGVHEQSLQFDAARQTKQIKQVWAGGEPKTVAEMTSAPRRHCQVAFRSPPDQPHVYPQ